MGAFFITSFFVRFQSTDSLIHRQEAKPICKQQPDPLQLPHKPDRKSHNANTAATQTPTQCPPPTTTEYLSKWQPNASQMAAQQAPLYFYVSSKSVTLFSQCPSHLTSINPTAWLWLHPRHAQILVVLMRVVWSRSEFLLGTGLWLEVSFHFVASVYIVSSVLHDAWWIQKFLSAHTVFIRPIKVLAGLTGLV